MTTYTFYPMNNRRNRNSSRNTMFDFSTDLRFRDFLKITLVLTVVYFVFVLLVTINFLF